MTLLSGSYTGINFLVVSGAACFGASASASMTDTDGLAVWCEGHVALAAYASIEDAALTINAECVGGAVGLSTIEEDVVFIQEDFYAANVGGSLGKARIFLDPSVPVFNRYLPEGQSS